MEVFLPSLLGLSSGSPIFIYGDLQNFYVCANNSLTLRAHSVWGARLYLRHEWGRKIIDRLKCQATTVVLCRNQLSLRNSFVMKKSRRKLSVCTDCGIGHWAVVLRTFPTYLSTRSLRWPQDVLLVCESSLRSQWNEFPRSSSRWSIRAENLSGTLELIIPSCAAIDTKLTLGRNHSVKND